MASVQELKDELQAQIDRARELADQAEALIQPDAVQFATQTGRLDFLSAILASLGVVLAIGGLFAFFEIRYRARIAAQETAKAECRAIASELLRDYANDELPDEVRRHVELIMQERDGNGGDYGQQDTGQV